MTNKYEDMTIDDFCTVYDEIINKQFKILKDKQKLEEAIEEKDKEYDTLEAELEYVLSLIRQKENEEIEKDYQEYCNTNTCPGFKGVF